MPLYDVCRGFFMDFEQVISGLGGAGATGAALAFLIRRLIISNDKKNEEQTKKIDKLSDDINDIKVSVSVLNTKVELLTKSVDATNKKEGGNT